MAFIKATTTAGVQIVINATQITAVKECGNTVVVYMVDGLWHELRITFQEFWDKLPG